MPLVEVLEMQDIMGGVSRVDVLARFVLGFRRRLRHLCLVAAAMGTVEGWRGVLAQWAAGLECLRSFQLRELRVTTSTNGVVSIRRSPGPGCRCWWHYRVGRE
jgi:hypothetical protein